MTQDVMIEKVAVTLSSKLWAVANSQDKSDCGGWEELPLWVQTIYREAAKSALQSIGVQELVEALTEARYFVNISRFDADPEVQERADQAIITIDTALSQHLKSSDTAPPAQGEATDEQV